MPEEEDERVNLRGNEESQGLPLLSLLRGSIKFPRGDISSFSVSVCGGERGEAGGVLNNRNFTACD